MASLFTGGKFQAEKASGVVPGAKLYTYVAGTTTPLATYTLQDGASANTNPVVCDANGQANVWLGAYAYRMILKDASDVTIWDVDNITESNNNFVWAQVSEDNSGELNDAAILAAAALCESRGGGVVLVPPGDFPSVSIIWDANTYPRTSLKGSGKGATIFTKSGVAATAVLDITASSFVYDVSLSDFSIVGNAKGNVGLRTTLLARFTVRNVGISACSTGWENYGSLVGSVYDVDLASNATGYRQERTSGIYPNLITFYGGQCMSNTAIGFNIVHGHGITWDHCDIELNGVLADYTTTGGIVIRSTANLESPYASFAVRNNWFEQNYGIPIQVEGGANLSITLDDCKFIRNTTDSTAIVAKFGAIESVAINSAVAISGLTGKCEFQIAASRTHISSSTISIITDTSSGSVYDMVGTFDEYIAHRVRNAAGDSIGATVASGINVNGSKVSKVYTIEDANPSSVTTDIVVAAGQAAGFMALIRGRNLSNGVAFSRLYLVAVKVGGGSGSDVASTAVAVAGDTTPVFTFSNVGGFVTITQSTGSGGIVTILGG